MNRFLALPWRRVTVSRIPRKGAGEPEAIVAALAAQGVPSHRPVVLVESASLPRRQHLAGTLATLPELAARR